MGIALIQIAVVLVVVMINMYKLYGYLCYHEGFGENHYKCGKIYRYPDSEYYFTQFCALYEKDGKLYELCLDGEYTYVCDIGKYELSEND